MKILLLIILAVGGIIGGINPVFFSTPNLLDILSNMVIDGIFAFAVMLGIIIGGIDVSFPAIAVSSMYITTRVAVGADYQGPLVLLFLMSVGIGLLLGLFNGLLITTFKLPAFIVTLGTSNLFYGLLISIAGGAQVNRLATPMEAFSKLALFKVSSESGTSAVPVILLFMLLVMAITAFILRRTMQVRACYPTDLMGGEMLIIAAVVLGGTTISGGRGTVFGTFLGLFLITMIKSSLILIGVPSVWQTFVVGMMIVIGTAVSAYQVLRDKRRLAPVMDPEPEVQKGGIS